MDVIEPPPGLRRVIPVLTAILLAGAYLLVQPPGADLPAQLYRTHLYTTNGFELWDNFWFAGHNLLPYSVLYPPLSALITPRVLGALAAVATAAAFEPLARRHFGATAWVGATWLAAATVTELVSGRLTFALGLAGAAVAALLLRMHFESPRGRLIAAAAVAAILTALASPVAGLFVALAGAAPAIAHRHDQRAVWSGGLIVVAALAPIAAINYVFPEGGTQPDAFSTVWPLIVVCLAALAVLLVVPGRRIPYTPGLEPQPTLTVAVVLYLVGVVVAFAVSTPVGANFNRLGELLAGPLLALLLYPLRRDRRALAVLLIAAIPLTYIQVKDAVSDVVRGASGGAYTQSYYQPLIRFLDSRPGAVTRTFRVEIPMTRGHWESYWVGSEFPLARGWERQLDIEDNPIFYSDRGAHDNPDMSAGDYGAWLHRNGIRYVALAAAPTDYSSVREVQLIDRGLPYLSLIARLPNWRIYSVQDATPIVTGAARLTAQAQDELALNVSRPGTAIVRIRFSPYWRLVGVPGCVAADGPFTKLRLKGGGTALLTMSFSYHRIRATRARCN